MVASSRRAILYIFPALKFYSEMIENTLKQYLDWVLKSGLNNGHVPCTQFSNEKSTWLADSGPDFDLKSTLLREFAYSLFWCRISFFGTLGGAMTNANSRSPSRSAVA
jgi:hypothetical protein